MKGAIAAMSDIYRILAPYYDEWNGEIDYAAWADHIERVFGRFGEPAVRSVLDLGSGTGSMTIELAKRGYDMIGVDLSPEMLTVARERAEESGASDRILWLCQDMTSFELYGTVDAVVSCLDSVNHLWRLSDLRKCFSLVHNYLIPNGLFLFDLNSRLKFETVYGNEAYTFEAPGVFCVWQNRYRPKTNLCDFDVTLFEDTGDGKYRRYDESERERMYSLRTVERELSSAGFSLLGIWPEADGGKLTGDEERWYIVARAIK